MVQRTIVLEYDGQKIVSAPFTFKHACIIDDERYKSLKEDTEKGSEITQGMMNMWAIAAIQKMFEGTILTDEIIQNEINVKKLREACNKVLDWYFGIDEEVKNS